MEDRGEDVEKEGARKERGKQGRRGAGMKGKEQGARSRERDREQAREESNTGLQIRASMPL